MRGNRSRDIWDLAWTWTIKLSLVPSENNNKRASAISGPVNHQPY